MERPVRGVRCGPPSRAADLQSSRAFVTLEGVSTTSVSSSTPSAGGTLTSSGRTTRLLDLDVIRGVALCGILFANIGTIMGVSVPWVGDEPPATYTWEQLLVQQRFFPIFSLLFGVGFGMLWGSAERRAARPRVVLLRRLASLGALGIVHQLLQPGEALLPYALAGIVVLLPVTWVPARARVLVATVAGALLTLIAAPAGGVALIPGLFLLGFVAAVTGLPRRAEESVRPGLVLAIPAGILAVPFLVLQISSTPTAGFDAASALAGLFSGMFLVGALTVLLHTPLRGVLGAAFAPLGRMALTNYVGATVIGVLLSLPFFTPLGMLRDLPPSQISQTTMVWIWGGCVLLLIAQSLFSRVWLARFGQGPLEKLWRWATWAGAPAATPATEAATG